MKEYDTSNSNYKVSIPYTQEQLLNFYQTQVSSTYIAPKRNKDIDGLLNHDQEHNIFYGPNYVYGTDGIIEYEKIINSGGDPSTDRYTIYKATFNEDGSWRSLELKYNDN